VRDGLGNIVATISEYLGRRTNNYAEYEAVILALEKVHELAKGKLGDTAVMVKLDSELIVKQMNGVYKIKHPDMRTQAARLKELAAPFGLISFAHVPREQNSDADALANAAMDRGANL
jgi:ribonuclease HI